MNSNLTRLSGRHVSVGVWALALALCVAGCDNKAKGPAGDAGSTAVANGALGQESFGLSPELQKKVLAQIGDTSITLGDFAAILARMDQFERLRYQSPDRRNLLLDEIIKVELLAQEAKRRGLDKDPEVQLRLRQALRDELKRERLKTVPKPDEIPPAEVQVYYAAHRAEYADPERRRLAHIQLGTRAKAEEVLKAARVASAEKWGELVRDFSLDKKTSSNAEPAELRGDLGIVSLPGEKDAAALVPDQLKRAVFEIAELGGVYPKIVESQGQFHIVRLTGKTEARQRSLGEAERTIRVALVQSKIRKEEAAFEQELRKRYPVRIDAAQLAGLKVGTASAAREGVAAPAPKVSP